MTNTPCPHLEALLPSAETGSKRSVPTRNFGQHIELFSNDQSLQYASTTRSRFKKYLISYGLKDYEVAVLIARFVDNKTHQAIATEQGWTSVGVSYNVYRNALAKLEECGISIPGRRKTNG